ncbi:MAG TPA: DUF5659 domain-containing protein [Bacteroidales bacterium]|nr:DUF5659 domain-containing protein [Bacteroidales bacterium]
MKKQKEIEISSVWICAYLTYSQEKLLSTVQKNGRLAFVFRDSAIVRERIADFLGDKATVTPSRYINCYQALKNIIYSAKEKAKTER